MFETTHKLPFEAAKWHNPFNGDGWLIFRIGTCHGQWRATETDYEILSVINDKPGNGHFEDVLQWFYNSCKRDNKSFRIREVWNKELRKHLLTKRGFKIFGGTGDVIKTKFK